ncbi:MAG: hypothetical protein WKG07_48570 [Hymenobacter sp.]
MLKTALSLCLLGLLTVGSAAARPAGWPFWLSKPERHGQRKMPGDYTPLRHLPLPQPPGKQRPVWFPCAATATLRPGTRARCTPAKAATGARRGCFKLMAGAFKRPLANSR